MSLKLSLLMLSIFLFNNLFASGFAGKVTKVRGSVYKLYPDTGEQEFLKQDSLVKSGDLIITAQKSFLKMQMSDQTSISLGANTTFKIKEFTNDANKRRTIFNLVHGKIRAKINQKVKEGQEVSFGSRSVAVGVRGTEFLSNAYKIKSGPVSDVALLEGKLEADVIGVKKVSLAPQSALNSNAIKQSKGVTTLTKKSSEALLTQSEAMLPQMQSFDGEFIDLNKAIENELLRPSQDQVNTDKNKGMSNSSGSSVGIGAPSLVPAVLPVPIPVGVGVAAAKKESEKEAPVSSVKIVETEDKLKDLPWDIKDALTRRDELRKENKCFYWIYKSLPGRSHLERFRRERDCDEFRNEL